MPLAAVFAVCAVVGAALTELARRWALRASILDLPNVRSSHTVPTPRGGGVAIVATSMTAVAVAAAAGYMEDSALLWGLVGGGLAVAMVSFVDDVRDIAPSLRAVVQFAAAAWLTYWIGPIRVLEIGALSVQLGFAGTVVSVFAVVWAINLFNFMDGIDGFAASETIVVVGVGGALAVAAGLADIGIVGAAVAGATLGFLPWNWHPARLFLGDVGSSYLGFVVAALALYCAPRVGLLAPWLIVSSVFWFDATVTLVRRAWNRETPYEAHRRHAYQRLVQSGWSHARTTTAVLLLNAVLASLAWAAVDLAAPRATTVVAVAAVALGYLWVETRRPMWEESRRTSGG